MEAELIIGQPSGIVRFGLQKGSYGIAGLAARRPLLGPAQGGSPAPELIVEWDPALRALMWRAADASRATTQALRPGETFALGEFTFGFSLKWDPPAIGGSAWESLPLEGGKSYQFGRGSGGETEPNEIHIALDAQDRTISKTHARLRQEGGEWILSDHSSTETLLNGEPFTATKLIFGDRFKIGDYVFEFRGTKIDRVDHSDAGRVFANGLSVVVKDRQTGQPLHILNKVGVQIGTGDFIGVLGGSGSGKSTLLKALCGIRPADQGKVLIGGIDNLQLNKLRPGAIGYVPQDDIVHLELVVRDAFYLAARLRLRLEDKQRKALADRTIEVLGLKEHAGKRVYHLSGGQRKRVSLGIELLSKPAVLFLDEPSSGLDPATEESLMELLQSLTLTNLTVVCTTHVLQKAYLFDRLIFVHGGRLIFEGNSTQARDFFVNRVTGIGDSHTGSRSSGSMAKSSPLERIYSEVLRGTKSPAEWEKEFNEWPGRLVQNAGRPADEGKSAITQTREKRVSAGSRFFTLLVRQWKILGADWLNLAFLFCQVIVIGLLIALVSDEFGFRLFLGLIATMWFGCSNGAQQIVSELPIVQREQICGLGRNVYLSSKFVFQGFISCAQALLLFLIIIPIGSLFHPIDFDEENFRNMYEMRVAQTFAPAEPDSAEEDDDDLFVPVDEESEEGAPVPAAKPETAGAPAEPEKKVPGFLDIPPPWLVSTVARTFAMEDSFIESGERPVNNAEGLPVLGLDGQPMKYPAISVWRVLITGVSLKLGAFFAAALVGVGLGLAVSAWVRTPTQAVMWVPLLLIPQILFGGYVVTLPKMSPMVRVFSQVFPSHSCQRIIDVSNLYGRATPFVTNHTKHPVFLTGAAEPEEISWKEGGEAVSETFDRESYVNTSWQNLAVNADRLGQHKKVWEIAGTDAYGSEIKRKRDTVETRGDVKYSKGTPFLFTFPAVVACWILLGWIFFCYVSALLGIHRKTYG
jgi:ABC-type multidrug transport system ATPase subunit